MGATASQGVPVFTPKLSLVLILPTKERWPG